MVHRTLRIGFASLVSVALALDHAARVAPASDRLRRAAWLLPADLAVLNLALLARPVAQRAVRDLDLLHDRLLLPGRRPRPREEQRPTVSLEFLRQRPSPWRARLVLHDPVRERRLLRPPPRATATSWRCIRTPASIRTRCRRGPINRSRRPGRH